ncbi:MAG: acyl carrier protein [Bacteroidetes bacterium]|nr:acyl carrier protein [Bacteroidota bacterium]MBU1422721.1 acyl carrier protein [Bacteroidota bacterium]MBU2470911.1 acyl carrier protein [Bacteroidota bacterium]MBU2635499.1 acyl carrier protein [Bacteroidota bacterium]
MSEEIKKLIIDYVKKEYLEEDSTMEVNENTKLISSGIVDSFSMVSLKMFIENKFAIKIPDDKATPEAFDSVNNIINVIKEFVKI